MTALDKEVRDKLRELALTNWDKFVEVTGVDIEAIKICHQRQKGKTLQEIANAMQMPKKTVWNKCRECI